MSTNAQSRIVRVGLGLVEDIDTYLQSFSQSVCCMFWTNQNKVLADIKQTVTDTLMTARWHVGAKLLTVSRLSKVNYQNKVLP